MSKQTPEGFADFVRGMSWDEIIGLKGEPPVAALEGVADSVAARLRSLDNVPAAIVETVVESVKKADPVAGLLALLTGNIHGLDGASEDVKTAMANALREEATDKGLDLPAFAFAAAEADDDDEDGDGDGDEDGDEDDADDDDAGDGDADDSKATAEAKKSKALVAMHEELATLEAKPDVQSVVREAVTDRINSAPMTPTQAKAAVRTEFNRTKRSSEAWNPDGSKFDDLRPQGDGVDVDDASRAAEADGKGADAAASSPLAEAWYG